MGRWETLQWLAIAYVAFLVLVFAGLPSLVAAWFLNASPRPGLRRLARLLLAADVGVFTLMLGAAAMPLLGKVRRAYGTYSRTYHLAAPRVLAGVSFPAGSTVYLNEDGSLGHGSVPVPTSIAGLPLVGAFETEGWGPAYGGTLAVPATIEGVPCQAGQVWWLPTARVSCVLDVGYAFAGHDLAAGSPVAVSILTTGQRYLEAGTLARAELLFDASWPAGTVFGSTSAAATPERLAHGPAPDGERFDLCLTAGQAVSIPGATLHGTATFSVKDGRMRVASGCFVALIGPLVGRRHPDDGYAEVGSERFTGGQRQDADRPWRWDNRSPSEQGF